MNVEIRARHTPLTPELRAHADQRLHLALSRFSNRIRAVRLTVEDVNGPKGGPDKRCLVTVKLEGGDEIVVEDGNADLHYVIDDITDRVARAVARALERQRQAQCPKGARLNGRR